MFIQDGNSWRLVELEEKVSEEPRAIDPQEPIIHELIVDIPLPPHRSSRVFRPPKRYMGMLKEEIKKIFIIGDKDHGDDLNTFDEVIDRKSTRLNSSHSGESRMPSSA